MKKYYVGFVVLFLVCVAAIVYTVGQGNNAKIDKATDKAVEEFSNKFADSYSMTTVPASLSDAGIKDAPSTVSYTKLSDTKYKVCFDYKQTAGGFDASWTGLLTGGLGSIGTDQSTLTGNGDGYFNSDVEFNHKKGQNCQTVSISAYPDLCNGVNSANGFSYCGGSLDDNLDSSTNSSSLSTSLNSTSAACGQLSQYQISGDATLTGNDTTAKQLTFNTKGETFTDSYTTDLPAIASIKYNSSTIFCGYGSATSIEQLKAGDEVAFYVKNANDTTAAGIEAY